jgi:transposase
MWLMNTDPNAAASYRQARGMVLAQTKAKAFRQIVGDTYLVPSATSTSAGYVVDMTASTCTCPDAEKHGRGVPCKHQWAIRYFRHELEMPDGTTVVTEAIVKIQKRPTYKQDWPAYNASQCEEKSRGQILLRALCDGIEQPPYVGRGRPPLRLSDAVYCATMKVWTTLSGRRATSDIRACEERGLVEERPCYNSIFNYIARPDLTPLFKRLIEEAAAPLRGIETSFAVDGTGFATSGYARWYTHKWGSSEQKRDSEDKKVKGWVKGHFMTGTLTNVVTAAEATDGNANDSPFFAPLVQRTRANGWNVREVSADKAYLSHDNLAIVEQAGGVPFIPFKSNSSPTGSSAWEKMYLYCTLHREDFLAHYHKRSNVESTVGMIKKNWGSGVRSKLLPAQTNEVLLKTICHNVSVLVHAIHELQIEPRFWMPPTMATGSAA